ncbi:hemolytic protein HlpA [soil metagenome]
MSHKPTLSLICLTLHQQPQQSMSVPLQTPILFLIFNRPDTTLEVFGEIRKAQPAKLYIAADGPRANRPEEAEKCREARSIVNLVDWPCEVVTLFREENWGCKKAVSSSITWFFEQVEEGIVLEDDCLPSPTFFTYCAELLERYRHDDRVMHITGDGQVNNIQYGEGSYYFSPFPLIWGWASWRRAWKHYDVTMASYPTFRELNKIADLFPQENYQKMWTAKFDDLHSGRIDTWDYQWIYAVMSRRGLGIIPNVNLITNIGFREDATHTTVAGAHLSAKPRTDMPKIVHPKFMIPNREAIVWIMIYCFFIKEYNPPLEKYAAYRFARSIYGGVRIGLGLNKG